MAKFKVLCTDIDGTLLNKLRVISDETKFQLTKFSKEKNFHIILISSRMPHAMEYLQKDLNINEPMICYNGGLILDQNKKVLLSKEVEADVVKDMHQLTSSLGVHLGLYSFDDWYVPSMDYWAKREENNTQTTPTVADLEEVISEWKKEKKGAHKMMCMGDAELVEKVDQYARKHYSDVMNIYRSKDTYLELSSKEVSKADGIQVVEDLFKITKDQVMAFGDNYNDVEMLEYAGLGVAMGNAPASVKDIADEVTASNIDDGIAVMLKKIYNS